MNILIVTQKVDKHDDNLGFFHGWIQEFARQFEKVTVIALSEGEHHLPGNVSVFSLGKEKKISRLLYLKNFFHLIRSNRRDYDVVFVHMNPIYVTLGFFLWKFWRKKIGLWYMHKHSDMKLRLAELLADIILTGSKESFRLASKKVRVVGHGIDTDRFIPKQSDTSKKENISILTVGRITPVKNVALMIETAKILRNRKVSFTMTIAGLPQTDRDRKYFAELNERVVSYALEKQVVFIGAILNKDLPTFLQAGDIFLNFGDNGSLDKAVLEALACGLQVITSNEAFKDIMPVSAFVPKDASIIAQSIIKNVAQPVDPSLREYVVKNHNLNKLIGKIASLYHDLNR